jgi:hypothetical protein
VKISNRLFATLAIATMTASSYAQLAEKKSLNLDGAKGIIAAAVDKQ